MIAIDTNIVVRLITHDDEQQYDEAIRLIETHQVLIVDTVILETVWVLAYAYQYDRHNIYHALNCLFGLANIHLTQATMMADVMACYEQGMDFADALHLALSRSTHQFYTFDKKFIKRAASMNVSTVVLPPASNH